MFNHDNDTLCAPLILKCLLPLAAVSVEYTVSFPVTVKSPETSIWSVMLQSVVLVYVPCVVLQFHSLAPVTPKKTTKQRNKFVRQCRVLSRLRLVLASRRLRPRPLGPLRSPRLFCRVSFWLEICFPHLLETRVPLRKASRCLHCRASCSPPSRRPCPSCPPRPLGCPLSPPSRRPLRCSSPRIF